MLLRQLFEAIDRTGEGNTAVVGWGRGMGHKGHMMLASSVITHAEQLGGDPYFVVSRTYGPDDPLQPEEKLAIYRKVFPKKGHIFQTATDELPDLTRVLTNLNGQGYKNAVVVVGADQKTAFQYLNAYNGKPNKKGEIPFSFDSLDVISRQETNDPSREEEGPRATPMRQVLTDPSKSEEEQFAVWRDAMSPELSDEEVMDLMQKAKTRMGQMAAEKPAKKAKKDVAEGSDPNKLAASVWVAGEFKEFDLTPFITKNNWIGDPKTVIKQAHKWLGDFLRSKGLAYSNLKITYKGWVMNASQVGDAHAPMPEFESMAGVAEVSLGEGPSLPSTLKSIATNGEPITQLYGKLQAMAKRWVDNNGSLKGFHRNAAGQSAQWFNNFYFNKLQADLYALAKQAPRHAAPLIMFLKDASEDRESRINFTEISRSLPPILFRMGKKIDDESLARFAASWDSRRKEYESYLADLESQADDEDDYDEPVVKPEKSKMPGQQNAQAEQIVNDILSKLPKNVAGDIRNAIARAPNKLQALHQELSKRKIQGVAEGSLNEFAQGTGGDDGEAFNPGLAKMAQEHGFTKGVSLADGASLATAFKITEWDQQFGGLYKQHFVQGFKKGRMDKINFNNKQYNLNLKLMKDGSIIRGEQGVAEASLGNVLPWPEVVNKVSSAMKATGWKGKRMSDDAFMFTTRGAEVEDQWYIAIIDNAGEGFFRYALGTVEEGDPHIDDAYRGKLPNTEASVSELINEIREGFGLA